MALDATAASVGNSAYDRIRHRTNEQKLAFSAHYLINCQIMVDRNPGELEYIIVGEFKCKGFGGFGESLLPRYLVS